MQAAHLSQHMSLEVSIATGLRAAATLLLCDKTGHWASLLHMGAQPCVMRGPIVACHVDEHCCVPVLRSRFDLTHAHCALQRHEFHRGVAGTGTLRVLPVPPTSRTEHCCYMPRASPARSVASADSAMPDGAITAGQRAARNASSDPDASVPKSVLCRGVPVVFRSCYDVCTHEIQRLTHYDHTRSDCCVSC